MTVRNEELNTNTVTGCAFDRLPFDLNDIGRRDMTSIKYTVNGFWSYDPITVFVTREFKRQDSEVTFYWKAEVSWSTGGRDTSTVPSSVDAAVNFANAIKDAASIAKYIEGESDILEAIYQAKRAEDKRLEKEQAGREQAAFDADPELGEDGARSVLDAIEKTPCSVVSFRTRGERKTKEFTVEKTPSGRITIRDTWSGFRIAKAEFINKAKSFSTEYYVR